MQSQRNNSSNKSTGSSSKRLSRSLDGCCGKALAIAGQELAERVEHMALPCQDVPAQVLRGSGAERLAKFQCQHHSTKHHDN
jgi:hypothetical protein